MNYIEAKKLKVGDKVEFCDGVRGIVKTVNKQFPPWFEVFWDDQGLGAIDCHDASLIKKIDAEEAGK